MPGSAYLRQARSTAFFVGVRVSGVGATTRTPSEPACFGGAIGCRVLKRALVARGLTISATDVWGTSLRQARSTAFFVGVRVSGVGATTRTPSEPACFGQAIGFVCSSGLLWLAV